MNQKSSYVAVSRIQTFPCNRTYCVLSLFLDLFHYKAIKQEQTNPQTSNTDIIAKEIKFPFKLVNCIQIYNGRHYFVPNDKLNIISDADFLLQNSRHYFIFQCSFMSVRLHQKHFI